MQYPGEQIYNVRAWPTRAEYRAEAAHTKELRDPLHPRRRWRLGQPVLRSFKGTDGKERHNWVSMLYMYLVEEE